MAEACFGGSGQPLAVKGRVLVGEGVLTKGCRKEPKPRQFFLFNDILVYGNIVIHKKKYNKQHIIPLEEVKVQNLEDEGEFSNGWLIYTRNKSFPVYAATSSEKKEWMAHIDRCIRDLLQKSGKTAIGEYAAPWVPDVEASHCMVCQKSQFTVLNRRVRFLHFYKFLFVKSRSTYFLAPLSKMWGRGLWTMFNQKTSSTIPVQETFESM